MDNYVDKAIDEVYDILLYNPTFIDGSTKKRVLKKMMDHYLETEEYEKCKMFKNSWICWREQMKIVVKSLDNLISSTKELGNRILYVVTDERVGPK